MVSGLPCGAEYIGDKRQNIGESIVETVYSDTV